jgi:hypothetical protein
MVNTEKKTASKKIVIKKKVTKFTPKREVPRALKPLASFGEYFKGAWFELRQPYGCRATIYRLFRCFDTPTGCIVSVFI